MNDNEPSPFEEACLNGVGIVFLALTLPFILPFWLIGKVAMLIHAAIAKRPAPTTIPASMAGEGGQ